ncbi:GAF domain-containing protein [Ferrovibrio sp.]|uniref:GAF domain-containing protein n=1 Tax=Ferrovibrio sp. TaxID=1917215 RepID=UPI0025BF7ECA|nr:GAF domain-containing protein [Ferrovibrio sp.]MBX3454405.1 GAF domain-containing protein [Ferrovibrio sp.]
MKAPEIPGNEIFRLAALHALPLLDTAPEADFDAVVRIGQALFNLPTCTVTLVDKHRQWFKARVGLDAPETHRDVSFCGHAILQDDVFVVADASQDERFHDNPLVTGAPFIRFYAGAPIRLPNGYSIGTVCVFGPEPRTGMAPAERKLLQDLAALALAAIGMRALRDNLDQAQAEADRLRLVAMALPQPVALADPAGRLILANEAFAQFCSRPAEEGEDVAALLDVDAAIWSPAVMLAAGNYEATIPMAGTRPALSVWRDAQGFVLVQAGR